MIAKCLSVGKQLKPYLITQSLVDLMFGMISLIKLIMEIAVLCHMFITSFHMFLNAGI